MRLGPPSGTRVASDTENALGSRGAACGRRPRRRRAAPPGCPQRPTAARAQPVGSSAPAMTSVGARTSARRSWRGSMAPCPAPRRLVARPAGRLRRRSARRRAARAGGSAAWLAKTGSRCHSSTKASIPSRSSRSARASSAARRASRSDDVARPADGLSRTSRRTDRRMRDGEAQGDPRAERVAEDVRRRADPPRSGSRRDRPRCARRRRVPGPTASPIGRARAGRPRSSGTTWRRPSRAGPSSIRAR